MKGFISLDSKIHLELKSFKNPLKRKSRMYSLMVQTPPRYHLGDKYDLIDNDTSSPTESITPITPRRRTQPPLSSRLADLNEELLLDNESR